MDNYTRVFFVVDSIEENEELFETLEDAQNYAVQMPQADKARVYIALVRNAYKDEDPSTDDGLSKEWNYDDRSDTFKIIKIIK